MHQESTCVYGMIEIWYDVQQIRSLEHEQFFGFKYFLMKKPTRPLLLFTLGVWTNVKSSGVNSCRKNGVSCALMSVSFRPNTSYPPFLTSCANNGPLFLMEQQLAKPSLSGPRLTATSPDKKIKLSWLRKPSYGMKPYGCICKHAWGTFDRCRDMNGASHVCAHQNGQVQDMVFCSAQPGQSRTLGTILCKKQLHDKRHTNKQRGQVTLANVRVTPVRWAIIPNFR